jgi:adenylate cyclase
MDRYELVEAADRAGVSVDELCRVLELAIVRPGADDRFSAGDTRRVAMVHSLVAAGVPLDDLGAAIRSGQVSLDFLDAPAFERFSAYSGETFAESAERTGVPVDLLLLIREAAGSAPPRPDDRIRDEELPYAAMIEAQVGAGFRPAAIQQLMRAQGDSLRRMAETESAVWSSEVIEPATAAGKRHDEILGIDFGDRMSVLTEQAVIAMYHLQQGRAWTAGIIDGLEMQLAGAGLHTRADQPPAMCFLDISGYTRHTEERGDAAAAELAEQLGHIVQRVSIGCGGRAVKWLGDGVMLHFPDPGQGVVAALDMVDGVVEAGLPPAHVGLHAGPVIFQEGDYYGRTVNIAARIAAYAQAGQVIVSQAVVEASGDAPVVFREIGPVELKGVTDAIRLHAAARHG